MTAAGPHADVLVVGGGVLGASIAYHLARRGTPVAVVDRGPAGFRASTGNFGLVWVQDKSPAPYLALTMRSAARYPAFARELTEVTGIDIEYDRPGGLHFCLGDEALAARAAFLAEQGRTAGFTCEMLDRGALRRLEPLIGPDVAGGDFCPLDGHLNPLALLRALHRGVARHGGAVHRGRQVLELRQDGRRAWLVRTDAGTLAAGVVVLAAGVGLPALAHPLGLDLPVRPQRGQILVTERLPPLIGHPSAAVRQTRSGNILVGASHEEVGFDTSTSVEAAAAIVAAALRCFPFLGRVALIRTWGALRPLTPDGLPIFEQPAELPGLYVATAHSGITLCPAVGEAFAEWIAGRRRPGWLPRFERSRFAEPSPPAAAPARAAVVE